MGKVHGQTDEGIRLSDEITRKGPRLLIIAYSFPPVPYSGTHRIIRLCKGLASKNIEVEVVSIPFRSEIPNDFEMLMKIPDNVIVHRTRLIDPWLWFQKWRSQKKRTLFNRFIAVALRFATIPDHQIFWLPFAIAKAIAIIRKNNIDYVMVTSPPNSMLLAGVVLKIMTGIKFIADFRDPVVGNVAEANLLNAKGFIPFLHRTALKCIEKVTMTHSDIIVANTGTHRKELISKYGHDSVHTIRNAYDESDYKKGETDKFDKFTIAHVGSVYGLRNPDVLFRSVQKMMVLEKDPDLKLNLLFVGLNSSDIMEKAASYGVDKYVTIKGMVPHKEAMMTMQKSHALLLLKASGPGSYGQVPAKFFEYIGTRNKIIYIGARESEVAEMIQAHDAGIVIQDDCESLTAFLHDVYHRYLAGENLADTNPLLDRFSATYMADCFSWMIGQE